MQAISQKFDDFKVSIAAGKIAYMAVVQLADEIIACKGPHTNNVSNAKDKLRYHWISHLCSTLMERVAESLGYGLN